ncbi:albusnodin family lasso peptide [Streptomyces sp. NPDC005863]
MFSLTEGQGGGQSEDKRRAYNWRPLLVWWCGP